MTGTNRTSANHPGQDNEQTPLNPAARRALEEAAARRAAADARPPAAKEDGGRTGPDPVRYGDWEKAGIATDF